MCKSLNAMNFGQMQPPLDTIFSITVYCVQWFSRQGVGSILKFECTSLQGRNFIKLKGHFLKQHEHFSFVVQSCGARASLFTSAEKICIVRGSGFNRLQGS